MRHCPGSLAVRRRYRNHPQDRAGAPIRSGVLRVRDTHPSEGAHSMRLAARFMSSLLIASLLLPSLLAAPVAASGNTDHFVVSGLAASVTAGVATRSRSKHKTTPMRLIRPSRATALPLQGGAAHANYTFVGGDAGIANVQRHRVPNGRFAVGHGHRHPGLATGSANTTVDAAAASHLVVERLSEFNGCGVSHNATVTAKDPFNNTDPPTRTSLPSRPRAVRRMSLRRSQPP